MLDLTQPMRTKGSHTPVTLLGVVPQLSQPIVGVVLYTQDDGIDTFVGQWSREGHFSPNRSPGCLDLENVP